MSYEITDRVPGLTDKQVADLVREAEAGYDLASHQAEPNLHFQRVQLVPEDLLDPSMSEPLKMGSHLMPSSAKRSRTTLTQPDLP